ncbi:MAG: hypothetical protein OXI60_06735 [Acidiferrobacterales bacterium]|nr:hypothetical protein [Acidiferrobacterales bacterium]
MAKSRRKKPRINELPNPQKKPRARHADAPHFSISWKFSNCDRGGNWAWVNLEDPVKHKQVIEKLQEFEKKNWNEIISSGSHPILVGKLVKPARNRLQEIELDDIDQLMSFRLSGKERVWCIQQQQSKGVMKVLWWDPNHEVCPVTK